MGRRQNVQLRLVLAAIVASAVVGALVKPAPSSASPTGGALDVASLVQPPAVTTADQVNLVWTFRQGDLMQCRTSARDLRRAVMAHDGRVTLTAVAIDTDLEYVRSFLRRERLDAEIVLVSEQDYRARFDNPPTPMVSLVEGERVIERFSAGTLSLTGHRGTAELPGAVSGLLSESPRETPGS